MQNTVGGTFTTFAAWVGILAFFFALPIAVIGNLITPKIAAWWATTSGKRRENRVTLLKQELGALPTLMTADGRWENLIKGLRCLAFGLAVIVYLIGVFFVKFLIFEARSKGLQSFLLRLESLPFSQMIAFYTNYVLTWVFAGICVFSIVRAIKYFAYSSLLFLSSRKVELEKELQKLSG